MSDLWLAVALIGTFLTIFVVGVIVDLMVRERNRPVALLQSHMGTVTDAVDLREEQLRGSAFDRVLLPTARRLGRRLARVTPFDLDKRIDEQLVLAGNPPGWNAERVVALKIVSGIAAVVAGSVMVSLISLPLSVEAAAIVLLTAVAYSIPSAQLRMAAANRQRAIQRQLADVMDLLTISVEAGLGFEAALSQVTKNVPGALSEEFARLLQEVQIGVSRTEAFRHLGERTNVPELQSFVLSMIQADLFGVSIANVLRAQSRELRQKRRQRAEEIAQKIPVKLLFPMIFLVLPALFIVVLGPGAIKIYQQFFGG
jgi:tight adherence protein C